MIWVRLCVNNGYLKNLNEGYRTKEYLSDNYFYKCSMVIDIFYIYHNSMQVYSSVFMLQMEYDIKAMPYVLYYWHCMCNYRPDELEDIPDSYKAIAKLINNFLNWLYDNVDELSEQLIE